MCVQLAPKHALNRTREKRRAPVSLNLRQNNCSIQFWPKYSSPNLSAVVPLLIHPVSSTIKIEDRMGLRLWTEALRQPYMKLGKGPRSRGCRTGVSRSAYSAELWWVSSEGSLSFCKAADPRMRLRREELLVPAGNSRVSLFSWLNLLICHRNHIAEIPSLHAQAPHAGRSDSRAWGNGTFQ